MPGRYWKWIDCVTPKDAYRIKESLATIVSEALQRNKIHISQIVKTVGKCYLNIMPGNPDERVHAFVIDCIEGDTEVILNLALMSDREVRELANSDGRPYNKRISIKAEFITSYVWPYNWPPNVLSLHNYNLEEDRYDNWYFGGQRVGKSEKYSIGARR